MTSLDGLAPAASSSGNRIAGLDVARAVAICLMILENFKVMMLATDQHPHVLVWLAGLTDGRSAPLFVTLAGVGISLISKSARATGDRAALRAVQRVLLKRALFFLIAGNLFILAWFMDILHFYAWYVALGALLLPGSTPRRLMTAAVALLIASTLAQLAWGDEIFAHYEYFTPMNMVRDTFLDGIHPVFPWLVFVVVGMWIGQQRLDDPAVRSRLLWGGLLVFLAAELLSDLVMELTFLGVAELVPAGLPHHLATRLTPPGPLYVVAASATSTVGIALCLMLAEARPRSLFVRAFAAAGQLSLTLYIGHALVGWGLLWLLGRDEDRSILFLWAYWAAYTFLSISFAYWYRQRWRVGPLEWVMRRFSGSAPRLESAAEPPPGRDKAPAPWIAFAKVVTVIGLPWLLAYNLMGPSMQRGCPDEVPTLTRGAEAAGHLTVTCRERWYDLDLTGDAAPAKVVVTTASGADTYLEIYDEDGYGPIAEDDDSGPGLCPRLETTLDPGSYRLKVRPYRDSTGPFTVRVGKLGPPL